ncbi:FANCI solenoid 1 domain-containing protein [Phthorimaea operculella]|nr:FANCI solenoid 1 domain-containing protein [Phthorimaea operculella]
MDVNKIFTKIKELGHVNSKRDELREYCKLKIDQIIKFLPRRVLNSDGSDLLDCIFNGLLDNPTSKYKAKIVDIVLTSMRKESTSLTHCGDVISRLCLELSRLPAQDLVRWCNDSVQSIIEDNDINMIWKDVLPECLSALSAHSTIQHCGTDMTVQEYKEQCTRTLCQCRWQEKQLVPLTAIDMQLPRTDHKQVVNKICTYIIDFPPDALPPLVHQLLKLCKSYHVEIVLAHLSHYFSIRLYSKLEPPPQDSESTTMDIDDIVQHSPAELSRCLSTCMYHICSGAAEPETIRKHIKAWPKTQLLRNPFLVDLALALSDKGADFRTVCLDVVRSAIEARVRDSILAAESSWSRAVLPPDVDVAGLLKLLTTESANHRQLTVVGLINLAFALLSVSKSKSSASACWSHGKLILARLSKSQPETAPHILSQLCDRLATDNSRQYADCLHVLCALTPVSLERCTQLTTILENCQPVPGDYKSAAAVLDAVHPLLSFSTRVRDVLVMVCRKGLYSRDSMHRCLALSGFLTVLRHVKLSRTFSSSQSTFSEQFSAHSYLTQVAVDVHADQGNSQVTSRVRNEAMCMEVVSILRRCLVQDAAVKELLYTKIYDCSKEKPVLHEAILELLYEHLSKYLPETDGDAPLLFDKCVQITPVTAVLTEPIARLLYCVAQFLSAEDEDLEDILESQGSVGDTGSAHLRSKLGSVMDQLGNSQDLGKINITDEPGLTDLTPESKAKNLKVQQILSCYEALVAHQITVWSRSSAGAATRVHDLFTRAHQLIEQTKATPKIGKKGSKSTLNETRETQKTQKSQKSQKEKGKAAVKVSNLVKDRSGPFKPLPCIWDLAMCHRVLELLYNENVSWSSLEERNLLRSKRDYHQWALQRITSVVTATTDKREAKTLQNIAGLLYKRTICRFQDMCNFDEQTTVGCVELFRECLALLLSTKWSLRINSFLPTITGLQDETVSACVAAILDQTHSALQLIEEESAEERDVTGKKLVTAFIQTATVLLETPVPPSRETTAIITKLEQYLRTSKQECLPLTPPLLTASYREMQDAALLDDLLVKLTHVLAKIDVS